MRLGIQGQIGGLMGRNEVTVLLDADCIFEPSPRLNWDPDIASRAIRVTAMEENHARPFPVYDELSYDDYLASRIKNSPLIRAEEPPDPKYPFYPLLSINFHLVQHNLEDGLLFRTIQAQFESFEEVRGSYCAGCEYDH